MREPIWSEHIKFFWHKRLLFIQQRKTCSFRNSFSEVSPYSDREECGREERGGSSWVWTFSGGSSRGSWVAVTWDLAMVVGAGWLPRGQRWSISRRMEGGWRLAFPSASIAFLTSLIKKTNIRKKTFKINSYWDFI